MRAMKNASTAALVGIWMILLTAFVVTILYVGRQLLIPLALAAMLTFLLAPLVGYIERWIGRIAAVLIVVAMLFSVAGGAGWLLTRQLIDLAAKLPDYQTNIDNRLHAVRLPTGGASRHAKHAACGRGEREGSVFGDGFVRFQLRL
jgi:predicted PurR-regulated permease PerM